jgi:hypothetical protein
MSCNTRELEEFSLPLPITEAAWTIAQEFAAQQPTPEKVEQVRLNTLAVCVVNSYLQMMGIATDLKASDSWNPAVRLCANVADLKVIGLGYLECRPITIHEQSCYIPPEVWEDRIGYVVVQFDELFKEVSVLGFTQTAEIEYLPISELQPLEDLFSHLSQLRQPVAASQSGATSQTESNLSQWLQDTFETGWQTIESLLGSAQSNLAFSFRRSDRGDESNHPQSGVRRAKLIDLGLQLAGHSVALIVELRQESAQKTGILLQVHPTGSQTYLPPLLQLIVIDESKEIFLEAQARSTDNYIQLQFSGEPGERFSVKVGLGNVSMTENFAI